MSRISERVKRFYKGKMVFILGKQVIIQRGKNSTGRLHKPLLTSAFGPDSSFGTRLKIINCSGSEATMELETCSGS